MQSRVSPPPPTSSQCGSLLQHGTERFASSFSHQSCRYRCTARYLSVAVSSWMQLHRLPIQPASHLVPRGKSRSCIQSRNSESAETRRSTTAFRLPPSALEQAVPIAGNDHRV
ncbi:hypothetical protein NDU88_003642 [Pleurodeles waltl]|uniref:Uncharacterized protein n=1 Tax=Pleurodeles waltl TaxID=8319 RepID=A0AAV7LG30_PLEWA|nr:hypothetical protein NDU88_003642 [Pleurodeles waltl]